MNLPLPPQSTRLDILQIHHLLHSRISDQLQAPIVIYRGRVFDSLSLAFRINNFDPAISAANEPGQNTYALSTGKAHPQEWTLT